MTVLLTFSLALTLAAITLAAAQTIPADADSCVITDTACTCTMQKPSGTCMRHQGNNACLMGECNTGYKCDCMGFEQCTVSNCSIYTVTPPAVQSESKEFACQLTPFAGKCILFASFMDTVQASDSAKKVSTVAVRETTADLADMTNDQGGMLADKAAVDHVLEQLDVEGAEKVTEEERVKVDSFSLEVTTALTAAHVEIVAAQVNMAEAQESDLKSGKARRVVLHKVKEAVALEEEEKVEQAKPENAEKCVACETMKARIGEIRKEQREAAVETGTWASKAREAKDKLKMRQKNIKNIKMTAHEARENAVAHSQKILDRLNNGANNGVNI